MLWAPSGKKLAITKEIDSDYFRKYRYKMARKPHDPVQWGRKSKMDVQLPYHCRALPRRPPPVSTHGVPGKILGAQ